MTYPELQAAVSSVIVLASTVYLLWLAAPLISAILWGAGRLGFSHGIQLSVWRHQLSSDWWTAYELRATHLHDRAYQQTKRITRADIRGQERRISGALVDHAAFLQYAVGALASSEVHMRVTHLVREDLLVAGQFMEFAHCANCGRYLAEFACFLAPHYVCDTCLETEVLSRFCAQRLHLMREAWTRDKVELCDLIPVVLRYIAMLCFDRTQIRETMRAWRHKKYCVCKYDCRTSDEDARMEAFEHRLRALMVRVDG